MKKLLSLLLLGMMCMPVFAQNAEKLYTEGKALYDAKNYKAAYVKLKAAADEGHKKAQYRLGRLFDKGNGVAENNKQAFYWYLKSAEQGFAKAQYQVGKSYKNGEGVDEDRDKAFQYFKLAAEQGNGDAQFALGKCYMKGKGCAVDLDKAKEWFLLAFKNEKDGKEILQVVREETSYRDADAKAILKLTGISK